MYKNITEAIKLTNGLKRQLYDIDYTDIVICPPFTAISEVAELIYETNIQLGAQNLHWEKEGAFTGEISAPMLKDAGCKYVIIGHSERRQFFGETNETVNKKIIAALNNNLAPIVCVGENLEQREKGMTFEVIKGHLQGAFNNIGAESAREIIIAYEPVWAIGTGKVATGEQAQEAHQYIRGWLRDSFGSDVSDAIRIQYGGSVKPDNISSLITEDDIDGALVGGASLKLDTFAAIILNSKRG